MAPALAALVISALLMAGCVQCGGNGNSGTTVQASPSWPSISLAAVADGFSQPLHITHAGDGSGRIFVTQRDGKVYIIDNGSRKTAPFLDISELVATSGGEQGLLCLAFPPDFRDSGQFFVNYTRASDGATVVSRHAVSFDPDEAVSDGDTILIVPQPYSNHNGGQLAFGPDGFLYIGLGDGGSGGDPFGNGQDKGSLLGKMLRVDVRSAGSPYSIPSDNPFVRYTGAREEIWALGMRNPWRFSFDRLTGDLYIADVGQNDYEEIDYQKVSSAGGSNYGWNIMEGSHCYGSRDCDQSGLTLPVAEYDHSAGDCSVTGGFVYRGNTYPSLEGIYLYGDYCTGRIWGLRRSGDAWETSLLLDTDFDISSFGEDEVGNVYVADFSGGAIYRIEAQ